MDSKPAELLTRRQIKGLTGTIFSDLNSWPTPDEGAIPKEKIESYRLRKKAVELYLLGFSNEAIKTNAEIKLKQIYRLITERCLATHADGLIYGWRGLIPNLRINPYRRNKKIKIDSNGKGGAGALSLVLEMHPDLSLKFEKRILTSATKSQLGSVQRPRKSHWLWFVSELSKLGYETRNEWPFNTKSLGYLSICRYINTVFDKNYEKAQRVIGGPDLERKMISGDGVGRPISNIYERVEMDAHKIDGIFCVLMPHSSGGHVAKVIHRIWVIAIIEIVSKAVLGYHLSLEREVNKSDVLRTIKKALSLWQRRPLSFGEGYSNDAGFPGNVSEFFLRACWNETSVDGALAETCQHVRETLKDVVGSTLITPNRGFSSRRSKDDRPFIEAFFKKLGVYGFQRISNTTGGKVGGALGRDSSNIAANSQFQYEYAEELLDVLIANYNATPHSSLGYRSPLEFLKFISYKDNVQLRYADPNSVQALLSFRKKCRVLGGLAVGKKPYVNFEGARYTSEVLGQRYDLVGKEIWVINHLEDDARVALSSLMNGMPLGILRAGPPWHRLPHSLEVRKAINSCINKRLIHLREGGDAIENFIKYCEEQKNKKLPVHGKYLELRRILTQSSEVNLTDQSSEKSDSEFTAEAPNQLTSGDVGQHTKSNLPVRRMATSKSNHD